MSPGDTRLRLTRNWENLPAGTYVRPLKAGMDWYRGELIYTRTVAVVSNPNFGLRVTGPF
jgi:hypothetical protein